MMMYVNIVENMPLTSTEFNQSGSYFTCFNHKHNKTHYREHIEKKNDNSLESTHNRVSIENYTIIKDLMLDTFCAVMDPNQLPEKFTSKLNVMLLTSDWKNSDIISCVEVSYCTTVQSHVKDKENKFTFSTIDRIQIQSHMEE